MTETTSSENPVFGEAWGYHFVLDCFGCSFESCCSLEKGYEFLDNICDFLGMTKQTQPYIFKTCEKTFPGRPGYSGWVPIIESGIQIHTSANKQFISIDVYSCRRFDPNKVAEFTRSYFAPKEMDQQLIHRGRNVLSRQSLDTAASDDLQKAVG